MPARRLTAFLATALALVTVLAPSSSMSHDVAATTRVTRFKVPRGATPRGDKVVLHGRLKAADPSCYAGISVGLYRLEPTGPRLLARDVTDGGGEYMFLRRPRRSQDIYVGFGGFVQTIQGHSHACAASESRELNLKVTR